MTGNTKPALHPSHEFALSEGFRQPVLFVAVNRRVIITERFFSCRDRDLFEPLRTRQLNAVYEVFRQPTRLAIAFATSCSRGGAWGMAFRFRKSVRIAPGVRINLSAKSAGVRVGPKGLGYTISTTGKKRLSASIPGTGLSYSKGVSSKRQSAPSAPSQLDASQTKPSSKGLIALLLLAIGAGLVWCGAPSNETKITSERSPTNGSEQPNLKPATAEPAPGPPRLQKLMPGPPLPLKRHFIAPQMFAYGHPRRLSRRLCSPCDLELQ